MKITLSLMGTAVLSGILSLGLVGVWGCSKSSSDPSGVAGVTLSTFATTLAEDMVLASPTAQTSSVSPMHAKKLRFKKVGDVQVMEVPTADDSAADKKDALEVLLAEAAPASCAISLNIVSAGRASCYGPSVNYTNHEFNNSSSSWPGGDLGIWEESVAGEACIAAQITSQMKGAISYVDMAQFISAGMSCLANKNTLTLPTEGTSLDLTSYMTGVVTINSNSMSVTSGTMAREANDSSGNPVYVTSLTGTAGSSSVSIRIKHIPTAADDSTNKGKISVKYTQPGTDGVSLEYEKTSATSGKMLLKKINFNSTSADPFVSVGNQSVNYAASWNNNADYFLAEINPSNYTGTFAYAWQAGNGDSNTRVFNAKLTESGGAVTGSAFFGFGPTMQTGAGAISGMICAWTGPDQTHVPVLEVQRQDIALTSGKFAVSGTSYTVFDPVADCEASGTMAMSWNAGANTRTVNSTTKNLVPLAEVTTAIGSLPTVPTNVDL